MQSIPHRLFSIPELSTHIAQTIEVVYQDDLGTPSENCATLAALAQVCTLVSKPALDQLWSTLYDLGPLVRLLPRDAYESIPPGLHLVRIIRDLVPEDFYHFDKYATRVRRLLLFIPEIGLPLCAWRTPLLPSLTHFDTYDDPFDTIPLISSRLTSLVWNAGEWSKHQDRDAAFLRSLPSLCPGLLKLDYSSQPDEDEGENDDEDSAFSPRIWPAAYYALICAIQSLHHLEDLECGPSLPSFEIFTSLSRCESLRKFDLRLKIEFESPHPVFAETPFPTLKEVALHCSEEDILILLSVAHWNLAVFELCLTGSVLDLTSVLSKITTSLSATSLTRLHFVLEADTQPETGYKFSAFLPLSIFSRLEELHLYWPDFEAEDHDIDLLTRPLVCLSELSITTPWPDSSQVLLTCRGLTRLVQNCPHLRILHIAVDFSMHQEDVPPSFVSDLEELDLLHSPSVAPSQAAAFIQALFPRLAMLCFDKENAEQWPGVVEKLRQSGMTFQCTLDAARQQGDDETSAAD